MSEDDRAIKAARAKALLARKRQQKKAADTHVGVAPSSGVASPISPRTFSPAPAEPSDEVKHDISDVFSQDAGDVSWVSSLPRATSPPRRVASPQVHAKQSPTIISSRPQSIPLPEAKDTAWLEKISKLESINAALQADVQRLQDLLLASRQTESLLQSETKRAEELQDKCTQLEHEKVAALQNERQTITLLVSEKASLSAELQRREDFESKAQAVDQLLQAERSKTHELELRLSTVQSEADEDHEQVNLYRIKEKDLTEKSRELERQLQLATASANDSRKEAEQSQRRLQELTEQIQSDDRLERLERSLKHTQDRSDELEFQLSKLKQAHASLKLERDELDARSHDSMKNERESSTKLSVLSTELIALKSELHRTITEKDALSQEKTKLRTEVETSQETVADLRDKLMLASSNVSTHGRQLQVLQSELKNSIRHAEDSEKTIRNLQLEGTNLMRSLDEMRPKIVELTDAKLDLVEQVEGLERALRNRDAAIAKLEASIVELQDQQAESEIKWQETISQKEKEYTATQGSSADLQKAYNELQEELETTLASLKSLEAQRTNHHQETVRHLEEIDRLTSSAQAQLEELSNVQHELEARRNAQEEEQGFLERAQNEIESLRNEINAKDDEVERLRQIVTTPTRSDAPQSLDGEMLGSLQQQHALDFSAAQSQIRAMENTIFDSEAKAHALQKQINVLQDQVSRLQTIRQPQRSFSPIPSRPSSRAKEYDVRRSSFGSHRPNPPPSLSRTVFDQTLSPETLHKRKVSLSMLKARIDSEVAVTTVSHPPSRALSPVRSLSGKEDYDRSHSSPPSHQLIHRPQFLDESHVFWCHSCQGDLVIL